jgi:hypothetical protein
MTGNFTSEAATVRATGGHELDLYQASLPVRLICTPRTDFVSCTCDQRLGDVRASNAKDAFDHLPVFDKDGAVIGVLDMASIEPLPDDESVESAYEALAEHFLVGAEVSIIDFLQQADTRPFRFLVTGAGISGLVSLSDVQKLPVRAALFAMVTQLEMAMAELIATNFKGTEWIGWLTEGRQQKLAEQMTIAQEANNQVSPLLYTQFADKVKIVREVWKRQVGPNDADRIGSELAGFEKLRNAVAHANEFGVTKDAAAAVAGKARAMRDSLQRIEELKMNLEKQQ